MENARLAEEIQKPLIEGLIALWTIDLSHIGMESLHFTTDVDKILQPISFGGIKYVPYPVKIEGMERSGTGSNTRPTLSLSDTSLEITALIIAGEGLQGARVTRIRTLARFLDDGVEPDTSAILMVDMWVIDSLPELVPGSHVVAELVGVLDMEQKQFPKQQITPHCRWEYRVYDTKKGDFTYSKRNPCPYVDSASFDNMNYPTTLQNDKCSKNVDGCKARFGLNAVLPFGGFLLNNSLR